MQSRLKPPLSLRGKRLSRPIDSVQEKSKIFDKKSFYLKFPRNLILIDNQKIIK